MIQADQIKVVSKFIFMNIHLSNGFTRIVTALLNIITLNTFMFEMLYFDRGAIDSAKILKAEVWRQKFFVS